MLDRDAFLRQEVESASPAKLRWMLIRKAIGHCQSIEQFWGQSDWHAGMQWLLLVQDILNELLAGITDKQSVHAKQIASIYVYLLKQVFEAGQERNLKKVTEVREILEIDLETWRTYVEKEMTILAPSVHEVSHVAHDRPSAHDGPGGGSSFLAFSALDSNASSSLNLRA